MKRPYPTHKTDQGELTLRCPGWKWMPGFLALNGSRYIGFDESTGEMIWADPVEEGGVLHFIYPEHMRGDGWMPDFSDAPTRGGLLELVRIAHGRPGMTTKKHPVLGWIVIDGKHDFLKSIACDIEEEALILALRDAPKPLPKPPPMPETT